MILVLRFIRETKNYTILVVRLHISKTHLNFEIEN